jgi:hypothetical protein
LLATSVYYIIILPLYSNRQWNHHSDHTANGAVLISAAAAAGSPGSPGKVQEVLEKSRKSSRKSTEEVLEVGYVFCPSMAVDESLHH